jgi:hypothetical protein
VIEGQTLALGRPCVVALAAFGQITRRPKLARRLVLAFFSVACALALLLLAG